MTKRGILTVADLRERCRIDPVSHCWHWLGAASSGTPRIHTLDYARSEKRAMSGPLAAWNIAHGEGPPRWARFVMRSCGVCDCLNPAHLRLMRDRVEIGQHQRRSGVRKGTHLEARRASAAIGRAAMGIVSTPDDVVRAIRTAPATVTTTALALRFGVALQTASRIRRGESRRGVAA